MLKFEYEVRKLLISEGVITDNLFLAELDLPNKCHEKEETKYAKKVINLIRMFFQLANRQPVYFFVRLILERTRFGRSFPIR